MSSLLSIGGLGFMPVVSWAQKTGMLPRYYRNLWDVYWDIWHTYLDVTCIVGVWAFITRNWIHFRWPVPWCRIVKRRREDFGDNLFCFNLVCNITLSIFITCKTCESSRTHLIVYTSCQISGTCEMSRSTGYQSNMHNSPKNGEL